MSVTGTLFTFGNSAGGRLGRGEDAASVPIEVTTFLGDNQRDQIHGVRIGYVSSIYENNNYDVFGNNFEAIFGYYFNCYLVILQLKNYHTEFSMWYKGINLYFFLFFLFSLSSLIRCLVVILILSPLLKMVDKSLDLAKELIPALDSHH